MVGIETKCFLTIFLVPSVIKSALEKYKYNQNHLADYFLNKTYLTWN